MVQRDREGDSLTVFGFGCRRIHTKIVLETRTPGRARMILEDADAEHEDLIMTDMRRAAGELGAMRGINLKVATWKFPLVPTMVWTLFCDT